jgi:sulfite exporter TauE/SafE
MTLLSIEKIRILQITGIIAGAVLIIFGIGIANSAMGGLKGENPKHVHPGNFFWRNGEIQI